MSIKEYFLKMIVCMWYLQIDYKYECGVACILV